jgi:hypothetical protein
MRTVSGVNPARSGRSSILFVSLAVIGLVLTAAPRAHACEVDDETDAVAEGLLNDEGPAASSQATQSMSCKLLVPGPHLRVTVPRSPSPADIARANQIRARIRQALAKYEDYHLALKDGFEIRFPNVQQKIYHFSNRANAIYSAGAAFDPLRPTSLLYEKDGGTYRLVGVMYTAPRHSSAADLDARFPISVAPWHLHTNFCLAPPSYYKRGFRQDSRFGPNGSIATEEACAAAGGTFKPVLYGWMTHVDFYDSYDKKN